MDHDTIPHILLDDREKKLIAIFDKKSDVISYESERLDIADIWHQDEDRVK